MVKALFATKPGGPDVLDWREINLEQPGKGEVHLKQSAIGVNFIDTYHRTGRYPGTKFPAIIGVEGAGVIVRVGEGVTDFSAGDRVCYPLAPGAYAEERLVNQEILIKIPPGISDEQAAAGITKGITVQHLFTQARAITPNDWVLFHAAAGGVGLFACQWAKHLGAKLIGTVSSSAKATLATAYGAEEVINYSEEDFVSRVKSITGGRGVAAAFDGVGGETPAKSVKCLSTFGTLCTFGAAAGTTTLTIEDLPPSISYTKGSIATLITIPGMYRTAATEFFDHVLKNKLKIKIGHTYDLRDGAQAHLDLENRKTTGSIILKP